LEENQKKLDEEVADLMKKWPKERAAGAAGWVDDYWKWSEKRGHAERLRLDIPGFKSLKGAMNVNDLLLNRMPALRRQWNSDASWLMDQARAFHKKAEQERQRGDATWQISEGWARGYDGAAMQVLHDSSELLRFEGWLLKRK
jgi:hypothetical protein